MPDSQEETRKLREEATRLEAQVKTLESEVKTLESECAHHQAMLALLLQAACNYRSAHAAMQQDLRVISPKQSTASGQSRLGHSLDQVGVKPRLQATYFAQTGLFAAIDMVQEEASQASTRGDIPPK